MDNSNIFNTTRVGSFMIDVDFIKNRPHVVQFIMSKVIPIRIVPHMSFGLMEYMAISEEFDELEKNEIIPTYTIDIHNDDSIKFIRKNYRKKASESIMTQIMELLAKHEVSMSDFKTFIRKHYPNIKDEAFENYDEQFLDALNLYVNRTKK